jgi:hypothetical protein
MYQLVESVLLCRVKDGSTGSVSPLRIPIATVTMQAHTVLGCLSRLRDGVLQFYHSYA